MRTVTTIRAHTKWLTTMQELADTLGISRQDAIMVSATIGERILAQVALTQEQLDRILAE